MKLLFLLFLASFCLISAKNLTKPRLFPLKPAQILTKSNKTSPISEKIVENSRVPLQFSQQSTVSRHPSQTPRNSSIIFAPLRYKTKSPDLSPAETASENAITPQNIDELSTNDENYQAFYSNYFRKYYENLRNTYNNAEETPGSLYINPTRNLFLAPFSQKPRLLKNPQPYAKILKIRQQNRGNPCFCEDPTAKFCDCDEIEGDGRALKLKPIILPIIQPIIERVPLQIAAGEECLETEDECSCEGNRDFLRKSKKPQCKCLCERRSSQKLEEDGDKGSVANINNANANNANILAQKNTLNKIGTVYAANYSTVNYNHHVHNYINGAEFKFKENANNSRENCEKNESLRTYYPNIVIFNKIHRKKQQGNENNAMTITTKVNKNELQKLVYRQNPAEIDENKENFTGVMNQAVENTIRSIKRRRLLRKTPRKSSLSLRGF